MPNANYETRRMQERFWSEIDNYDNGAESTWQPRQTIRVGLTSEHILKGQRGMSLISDQVELTFIDLDLQEVSQSH